MSEGFVDALAGFVGTAKETDCTKTSPWKPPVGDYNLQLVSHEGVSDSNDYGPYVKITLGFKVVGGDAETDGREFSCVYFINKMKDGSLSFDGRKIIQLAAVLAGEPIEDNNPVIANQIVAAAVKDGTVIGAKVFHRKNGYAGVDPTSVCAAE